MNGSWRPEKIEKENRQTEILFPLDMRNRRVHPARVSNRRTLSALMRTDDDIGMRVRQSTVGEGPHHAFAQTAPSETHFASNWFMKCRDAMRAYGGDVAYIARRCRSR